MVGNDGVTRRRLVRYSTDERIARELDQDIANYRKREFSKYNVSDDNGSLQVIRRIE